MIDSTPVLRSRALIVTITSAEMIPKINLGGRGEPVGPAVGHRIIPSNRTCSVSIRDKGGNGPNGPVGP